MADYGAFQGALNQAQLLALAQKYFGDLGPDAVRTAYEIAMKESGGNPSAYNGKAPDNSYGLWQINVANNANPELASMNLRDPEQNARAARIIYNKFVQMGRPGFSAWSTWDGNSGAAPVTNALDPATAVSHVLQALMQAQPDISKYHDEVITDEKGNKYTTTAAEQYNAAMYGDGQTPGWIDQVSGLIKLQNSLKEQAAGVFRMDDGTVVTQEQMAKLDPGARAQVQAMIANKNADTMNTYNKMMHDMGLEDFLTGQNSVGLENSRVSNDFQNQLSSYREMLGLDQANQNTALHKIDRSLNGMQEARARASTAMDTLLRAAPWGTSNGKTSFSPNDLGSAVASMARIGNLDPSSPILNFTGTQTINPNQMFNYYDQQLGVGGPLPQVPDLTTTPGMIPRAPASTPIPQYSAPNTPMIAPTPLPIPGARTTIADPLGALPTGPIPNVDPNTLSPQLRALYGL